jgi:glycosyltransferase involved in cell wall biosynthesis
MKRLSIILPMYKVANYVERCIRSLEDQDIPKDDYELICINDGSPDNCREIIQKLQFEYENIILIDQINQGVSQARNNGIDIAASKYLLFIDPDDFVERNTFFLMLNNAEEQKAQVSFLGFTILNIDGSVRSQIFNIKDTDKDYLGIEAYFLARGDGFTDPDRTWGVLFERDFINRNNLRYLPDVPYLEDGELIARILSLADRCIFNGNSFYCRTIRSGSATNSNLFNSENAINGFIKAAVNLRNFRDNKQLTITQKEFINQPILKFVILTISSTAKLSKLRIFLKIVLILKDNYFGNLDLIGCNKYYRKLGTLYNISVFLLYLYMLLKSIALFVWNLPTSLVKSKAKY